MVHVICIDGSFDGLPDCIRHFGPWSGHGEHDLAKLEPLYRAQIAAQQFAFIYESMITFKADTM